MLVDFCGVTFLAPNVAMDFTLEIKSIRYMHHTMLFLSIMRSIFTSYLQYLLFNH